MSEFSSTTMGSAQVTKPKPCSMFSTAMGASKGASPFMALTRSMVPE